MARLCQEHVWNARRSVNVERHMVRSVFGWFHESRNRVPTLSFAITTEIS